MHKNSLSSLAFFSSYSLLCAKSLAYNSLEIGAELQKMRDYICYHHVKRRLWRVGLIGCDDDDGEQESALFLCGQWNLAVALLLATVLIGNDKAVVEKRGLSSPFLLLGFGTTGSVYLGWQALVNDFLGPPKGSRSTGKHWSFKTMNVVFLPLDSWENLSFFKVITHLIQDTFCRKNSIFSKWKISIKKAKNPLGPSFWFGAKRDGCQLWFRLDYRKTIPGMLLVFCIIGLAQEIENLLPDPLL